MAIEIRELVVRASVDPNPSSSVGRQEGGRRGRNELSENELEEIIQLCVERIMAALREQKER